MIRGNFGGISSPWKSIGMRAPVCSATCITEPWTMHNFYDVFSSEDVPRAREDKITHLGGQKSTKLPFWGREWAFSGQTDTILKSPCYRNYCTDCNQSLYSGKDCRVLFVNSPNTRPANPKWRTAAILEKWINRDISATVWPIWTKFCTMSRIGPLDAIGRQNFQCAKNKMAVAGRPLPEVVYISVTVGRRTMGIVSCESERRGLFQENYFCLCQTTSSLV